MKSCLIILITLIIGLFVTGCSTVNQVSLDKDAIQANASNASVIRNADGSGISISSKEPVQIKDDKLGITTSGTGSYIILDTTNGTLRGWLAKDATMKDVKYTPKPKDGESQFEASEIIISVSAPIAASDKQVTNAQNKTAEMTDSEAGARSEATKVISDAAKDIAKTVTDAATTGTPSDVPASSNTDTTESKSTE